jgi:DNA-binding XRE family transcriptional regulator
VSGVYRVVGGTKVSPPSGAEMDAWVGSRLLQRRTELGLSRAKLAALLTVSQLQIQKYEKGVNRISAGRLYVVSVLLAVPVSWFFEGGPRMRDGGGEQSGTSNER